MQKAAQALVSSVGHRETYSQGNVQFIPLTSLTIGMTMKYIYIQMCVNLKSGEILKRECEISNRDIVRNGYKPSIQGLLALLNHWNTCSVSSVHPELRWFYCTFDTGPRPIKNPCSVCGEVEASTICYYAGSAAYCGKPLCQECRCTH